MTKIEYSDRHRFIASLGLVLIGLSGIIPWLYLREHFDLLIKKEELEALTDTARNAIQWRQDITFILIFVILFVSVIFLLAGVCLLKHGLAKWTAKQDMIDERERLDFQAVKKSAKPMSTQEIEEKILEDTEFANQEKPPQSITFDDQGNPTRILNSKSPRETVIFQAENIERRILDKIESKLKGTYEIMRQKKIANRTFDAICASKIFDEWDRLVEIKYLNKMPTKDMFYRLHDRMFSTASAYTRATGRPARGVLYVVVPSEEVKENIRKLWFKPMLETLKSKQEPTVHIFAEHDIDSETVDITEAIWEPSQFEL